MRVWIDTDVGDNPDDAVALLLADRHPECELVGVSTVDGDVTARAGIVRTLLGPEADLPIVAGNTGLGEAIAAARPDVVVAVGPLTNVARALDPRSRPVVAMGGLLEPVDHRGERHTTETNFAADPDAAAAVVSGHDLTLVPLDVTSQMTIDEDQRARLATAHPHLAGEIAVWRHPVCLHDPLAVLVALGDAPGARFRRRSLAVAADGRLSERGDRPSASVLHSVDVESALARVLAFAGA